MSFTNQQRAGFGGHAVIAGMMAADPGALATEPAETVVRDVLAYIAHYCDLLGIDPETTFKRSMRVYGGDFEDDPRKAEAVEGFEIDHHAPLLKDNPVEPPPELRDAWRRFQAGEHVESWEMIRLDEWREDVNADFGPLGP